MASRFRKLGLATILAGAPVLSGCELLVPLAIYEHGRQVGQGMRDAAAINAGAEQNKQNYFPITEPFTCSYTTDYDGDGCVDPKDPREIVNRGKVIFMVGDVVTYAVHQENCRGKTLRLFGQEHPGSPITEAMDMIIQKDRSTPQTVPITLDEPGVFQYYWTLDGVKIGEHLIQVKPR